MKVIPIHELAAPIHGAATTHIPGAGEAFFDRRGRGLRDLRISVTDRCNFRCVYCMPRAVFDDSYNFLNRRELLSFEEILRVARLFVDRGVKKIRITGGEPLLRKNIERLIEMLARLDGVEVTLTTNGVLLPKMARTLKDVGLQRVTVSLDALDDALFRRMNDANYPVAKVLEGIAAAHAAGLGPIKVNMVVKRGTNDGDIEAMASHFRHSGHILRFIEFMDVGASNGWNMGEVLPSQDIITRIGETEDLHEAIALNTYARAELARLVAIRTRIKAAHTQPLSEEQLAMAAAQAAERQFMDFTLESLR